MNRLWRLTAAALLIALAVVRGHLFAPSLLTLDGLREHLAALTQYRSEHPLWAALIYVAGYILTAVLAMPGSLILTVAGGAVFGLWQGVALTSFASALGAMLSMLTSRLLLRQWVAKRFAAPLGEVNRGLAGGGWVYLASLRLMPVLPFFLINLLFGLTRFPAGLFYLVSLVFMLPATFVYVNAGTQLGALTSLSDIVSPGMLGALLLLALLGPLSRLLLRSLTHAK
jgi:uncharacterized membrane protein YdjX (TVP38/TMEM64 family)